MGQLIKSSGEVTEVKPANGTNFSLEELQQMVGGWIEAFWVEDKRWIVNEEGLLLDLPENLTATQTLEDACGKAVQTLVGNVVILDASEIQ